MVPRQTGRRASQQKPPSCRGKATGISTRGRRATRGCGCSRRRGSVFVDGSHRRHYAVLTELPWEGGGGSCSGTGRRGIVEHAHVETKSALGSEHIPARSWRLTRHNSPCC